MPLVPGSREFQDFVRAYESGETSLEAYAVANHLGQTTLRRQLVEASVQIRGRSDATRVRLAKLGRVGRLRLTAAAHEAVRGTKVSRSRLRRQVITKAINAQRTLSYRGRFEDILGQYLEARKALPIPQQAVDVYNIDIGLAPIAVEVKCGANNPLTDRKHRKRIKRLLKLGWSPYYVWITAAHPLTERAADEVIAWHQRASRDPAARCQYRVIRGGGQFVEAGTNPYKRP